MFNSKRGEANFQFVFNFKLIFFKPKIAGSIPSVVKPIFIFNFLLNLLSKFFSFKPKVGSSIPSVVKLIFRPALFGFSE